MHCPQCGQQQVPGQVRFCSRCGFPLDGVMELLANGGVPIRREIGTQGRNFSPRQKGLRQGAMLMLSTLLVVPVVAILSVFLTRTPHIFIPLAAFFCFIGGLLRIFYALFFEEDWPRTRQSTPPQYTAPGIPAGLGGGAGMGNALPPPRSTPVTGWHKSANTAELVPPPSVTENTTRLLNDPPESKAR